MANLKSIYGILRDGSRGWFEEQSSRDIIDNNADGFTYFGSAPSGSETSDPAWIIERQSNTSPDEFVVSKNNQVWDNRATTVVYNEGVA